MFARNRVALAIYSAGNDNNRNNPGMGNILFQENGAGLCRRYLIAVVKKRRFSVIKHKAGKKRV